MLWFQLMTIAYCATVNDKFCRCTVIRNHSGGLSNKYAVVFQYYEATVVLYAKN